MKLGTTDEQTDHYEIFLARQGGVALVQQNSQSQQVTVKLLLTMVSGKS